jgi:hypothetical protein
MGGGGGGPSRAIKFLYEPAPPPPTVWALKPPSWALVHKTTYAPVLYVPVCNDFDAGSIHYLDKWEGVGPWKSRVFGPKKLSISRAQPRFHLPSKWMLPASKAFTHGAV